MGTMERILRLMADKKASDVYLSANAPAMIKINGQAVPINNQLLPADAPIADATGPTFQRTGASLARTPDGRHTVSVTVRGARVYRDPTDPAFSHLPLDGGTLEARCTFSTRP